ncbi:exo-alpha-sialidase [bacterium]|nr:exo-alpha-sialidase [bacterium]
MRTTFVICAAVALFTLPAHWSGADPPVGRAAAPGEVVVFEAGRDGYKSFRIPAVVAGAKGTLLALCEGRKNGTSDTGDIDVVLRRSTDGGATWGALQVVADDGADTVGNPCPVLDRTTGRVWLPLTRNPGANSVAQNMTGGSREVLMCHSDDDGATWSRPENISASVKRPGWTWYATGPGVGVQLRDGRLVVPCDHRTADSGTDSFSHVVVADDHGRTWRVGGVAAAKTNECQVAERDDGSLLLNMRSHHGKNRRAVAVSTDRGDTWGETTFDDALVEPTCQGSLIRVTGEPGGSRFLFSNPASTRRETLTLRLSRDGGRTWPAARVLYAKGAAYSCLVALPGGRAGCLYEKDSYRSIAFARFGLDWLAAGRDGVHP